MTAAGAHDGQMRQQSHDFRLNEQPVGVGTRQPAKLGATKDLQDDCLARHASPNAKESS